MDKIRLLVVDDHPVVRAGLRALLKTQLDMEVVGEAMDGVTAVQQALALHPDIVIMDLTMAGASGFAATREITRRLPDVKVLVLTMHDDEEYLHRALDAGAVGYVLKQAVDTELAVAIRAVHRGEIFLYPSFTRVLLQDVPGWTAGGDREPLDSYDALSPREKEVLRLIALGHTNRQIAERLCLSVKTVETYRARVMEKLGLHSRSALVRYALDRGLLDG